MKVLVTGASGMLGSSVANLLARRGDDVTVLQRRPSGLGLREVLADIKDRDRVREAVRSCDGVVHLAAKVNVVGPWSEYVAANVEGTESVVEAARAEGVASFVHTSSPSVAHAGASLVGAGAQPADPDRARGRYSRSKAMAERVALGAHSQDFAVVAVRPHLVWGPGDRQLIGRIVDRARARRLAVVGSGTSLIDTTYVDNAADALVAALDRAGVAGGEAYVVSNGEPRPVREILESVCAAAGVPGPRLRVPFAAAWLGGAAADTIWSVSGRDSDPPMTRFLAEQLSTAHWFDQRRTQAALAWAPRIRLQEGFQRLAAFYAPSGRSQ